VIVFGFGLGVCGPYIFSPLEGLKKRGLHGFGEGCGGVGLFIHHMVLRGALLTEGITKCCWAFFVIYMV